MICLFHYMTPLTSSTLKISRVLPYLLLPYLSAMALSDPPLQFTLCNKADVTKAGSEKFVADFDCRFVCCGF